MHSKHLIITCILCLISGMLFWCYMQEIIIIRRPIISPQHSPISCTKKEVSLFFWSRNKWYAEKTELIWSQNQNSNVQQLVDSLLALMHEEQIMHKHTMIQTILSSPDARTVYISFARCPFAKEDTTYHKWMLLESILKTIRENGIPIDFIHFLINHSPIHDPHIDFSKPWPILGFCKELQ